MAKTMTPSAGQAGMTDPQIDKAGELFRSILRRHRSSLPSGSVQQVLETNEIWPELLDIFRKRVEMVGGVSIRSVTVDYSRTLPDMIEAGHYNYADPDITPENFPMEGVGQVELDLYLVHFNRAITSEQAIAELKKMGMRPATLPELLAFGEKYPDEQRQYPVIALGSVWRSPRGRCPAAYLGYWSDGRELGLPWFAVGWDAVCRFLVVHASA